MQAGSLRYNACVFTATEGMIIRVTDLAPGRDFFGRVLQLKFLRENAESLVYKIPGSRLTLALDPDGAPQIPDANVWELRSDARGEAVSHCACTLVLLVEDIDTAVHYLNRHCVRFLSPIRESGGLWICEIADPYGNAIGIAQLNEVRE